MYKVIGADGKEYGPVSADVLREWINQGRANGLTSVLPEGATTWQTLAQLPEFEPSLAAAATPKIPPPFSARPAPFAAGPVPIARTNPLATAGLVCGVVSITVGLCCCNGFPFNLAGIIFSIIALSQINKDPVNQEGKGIAIAGLIISILSLLLSGLLLIVWGSMMAMPDAVRRLQRL